MTWEATTLYAALTEQHGPRGPIAIVAPTAFAQACARMFTIGTNGIRGALIRIFHEVGAAEAWLAPLCDPSIREG